MMKVGGETIHLQEERKVVYTITGTSIGQLR